jgi:hypothetical protein
MENTMTTNPHNTKEFWDDIKVDYIARAKDIAALGSEELEALQDLFHSSTSLSESVDYFLDLEYDDLVVFIRSAELLSEKYDWNPFLDSFCEEKRRISKASSDLAALIQMHDARLSLRQVRDFSSISGMTFQYLKCEPNEYQMKRFEEFGITWEGDVRDH